MDTALAPATRHERHCVCAECTALHAAVAQRLRADRLQQEVSRLEVALEIERRKTALAEYRRLTAETHLAVARNDRQAWAAAIAEREGVDVSMTDASDIQQQYQQEVAA